jgi:hypothetical protein
MSSLSKKSNNENDCPHWSLYKIQLSLAVSCFFLLIIYSSDSHIMSNLGGLTGMLAAPPAEQARCFSIGCTVGNFDPSHPFTSSRCLLTCQYSSISYRREPRTSMLLGRADPFDARPLYISGLWVSLRILFPGAVSATVSLHDSSIYHLSL